MSEPGTLLTTSGDLFASGVSAYFDAHPEIREPLPRIYAEFQPEGIDRSLVALVDTGGHYCILHPDIGLRLRERLTERLTQAKLRTAQGLVSGELHVHRILLLAQSGDSLEIDVTLFLSPDWRGPNVLGYVGALDRMRFAIDPGGNFFYFGPLA